MCLRSFCNLCILLVIQQSEICTKQNYRIEQDKYLVVSTFCGMINLSLGLSYCCCHVFHSMHCKWCTNAYSSNKCTFLLYLTAAFLICMFHVLFPLNLIWMYLGVKCWSLHILLNHIAAFAVRNIFWCSFSGGWFSLAEQLSVSYFSFHAL